MILFFHETAAFLGCGRPRPKATILSRCADPLEPAELFDNSSVTARIMLIWTSPTMEPLEIFEMKTSGSYFRASSEPSSFCRRFVMCPLPCGAVNPLALLSCVGDDSCLRGASIFPFPTFIS